jgi:hypothetical protein
LGCRNVSKLFVPKGYSFDAFFEAIFEYQEVIHYEKYANNYDYNKAVFLMSNFKLLDNGFLTLKEDSSHASPISSVFYEYYDSLSEIEKRLEGKKLSELKQVKRVALDTIMEAHAPAELIANLDKVLQASVGIGWNNTAPKISA